MALGFLEKTSTWTAFVQARFVNWFQKVGTMNAKQVDQMELGLEARARRNASYKNRAKQNRQQAKWWFSRMRQVVGSAMEWAPETEGRPVQACLELAPKQS